MRPAVCFAFVVSLIATTALAAHAQAAQAAAGLASARGELPIDTLRKYQDSTREFVRGLRADSYPDPTDISPFADAVRLVVVRGERAASQIDPSSLHSAPSRAYYARCKSPREKTLMPSEAKRLSVKLNAGGAFMPPATFPFTVSKNTVFSVGISGSNFKPVVSSLDIGANLIGSVFSAGVGALGAPDALKDYHANNLALGIGLPTQSGKSLSSGYSVGLGSVEIGRATIGRAAACEWERPDTFHDAPRPDRQTRALAAAARPNHRAAGWRIRRTHPD